MLEATRKGMWKASQAQISKLATLHTDLVKEFGVTSSEFSSENKKLQAYISQKAPQANAEAYQKQLKQAKESSTQLQDSKDGKLLKKEETSTAQEKKKVSLNILWVGLAALVALIALVIFVKKRRK